MPRMVQLAVACATLLITSGQATAGPISVGGIGLATWDYELRLPNNTVIQSSSSVLLDGVESVPGQLETGDSYYLTQDDFYTDLTAQILFVQKYWNVGLRVEATAHSFGLSGGVNAMGKIEVNDTYSLFTQAGGPVNITSLPGGGVTNFNYVLEGAVNYTPNVVLLEGQEKPDKHSSLHGEMTATIFAGVNIRTLSFSRGHFGPGTYSQEFSSDTFGVQAAFDQNGKIEYGLSLRIFGSAGFGSFKGAFSKSLKLQTITFIDGSTPEDHGLQVVFASGAPSPNLTVAVVPEPSSIVLLGIGGVALCGYGLRRKRKTA